MQPTVSKYCILSWALDLRLAQPYPVTSFKKGFFLSITFGYWIAWLYLLFSY
jgi:hypothetical protein